jgi:hypothetical protein
MSNADDGLSLRTCMLVDTMCLRLWKLDVHHNV